MLKWQIAELGISRSTAFAQVLNAPASIARRLLMLGAARRCRVAPDSSRRKNARSRSSTHRMPLISDPQVSPDGKQILFVMDKPDWKANRRVGHIYPHQRRRHQSGPTDVRRARRIEPALVAGRKDDRLYRTPRRGQRTIRSICSTSTAAKRAVSPTMPRRRRSDLGARRQVDLVRGHRRQVRRRTRERSPPGRRVCVRGDQLQAAPRVDHGPRRQDERRSPTATSVVASICRTTARSITTHRRCRRSWSIARRRSVGQRRRRRNAKQLTKNEVVEGNASLSPDSSTVVFSAAATTNSTAITTTRFSSCRRPVARPRMLLPNATFEVESGRVGARTASRCWFSPTWAFTTSSCAWTSQRSRSRRSDQGRTQHRNWRFSEAARLHVFTRTRRRARARSICCRPRAARSRGG